MTITDPRPGRAARWAALLAAAIAGAGAIASPAAAQPPPPTWPYLHGDVAFDAVAPGDTVDVTPTFFQEEPLPEDTAAVIVVFYESIGPGFLRSNVHVEVPYDNCRPSAMYSVGPHCIITDFEDFAGSPVTLTRPARYEVQPDTPGPVDICGCHYSVFAVDAEHFESRYAPPDWDPDSDNLLDLQAADSWDGPSTGIDPTDRGLITIRTTEHPYDLAVEDEVFTGAEGEEIAAPVLVENLGPAATLHTLDIPGSVTVRGELPDGLELVLVDFADEPHPAWTCLSTEEELAQEFARIVDETELDRLDFACFSGPIAAEDVRGGLRLTVKIADADAVEGGMIETATVTDDGWPQNLESDLENNRANIVVDVQDAAGPAPKLPETGTSSTVPLLVAAAALVLGTALFIASRRRNATDPR